MDIRISPIERLWNVRCGQDNPQSVDRCLYRTRYKFASGVRIPEASSNARSTLCKRIGSRRSTQITLTALRSSRCLRREMGETRAIGRKNVVSVAMLGSRHSILDFYNTITLNGHHGFLIYSFLACTNLFSEYLTTYLANIWPRSISGVSVEPATSEILRKLHRVLRWLAADRSARARGAARKTVPVQRRTLLFDLQRSSAASVP